MVYVIGKEGKPLMPTKRHAKVRKWLKSGQAKVVKRKPFVIQLLFETTEYVQAATLGIDSGYSHVGVSAINEKEELFSAEVSLLQGMKERNEERVMYRRNRRKLLRHRAPRFDNRKRKDEWLAPSVQHRLDSHIRFIENVKMMLPIAKEIIEVANFDTQKIMKSGIKGIEYQEGAQKDFWNLREYILHRDGHKCQNPDCKNKSANPVLCLHHIIYRSSGGTDAPWNLITLCDKCHTPKNHKGFLLTWRPKIKPMKGATFMTMVRWKLVNALMCEHTYGYETKSKRIEHKIEKSHANDAFVIAGGTTQKRAKTLQVEQVRRNNRSLLKFYDAKYVDTRDGEIRSGKELFSGRTKRNKKTNGENLRVYRGQKVSKGRFSLREGRSEFQPKDVVRYTGKRYEVVGSQNKGAYVKLKGLKKVPAAKELTILAYGKGFHVKES